MAHHKRRRPYNRRAGHLGGKKWKMNGAKRSLWDHDWKHSDVLRRYTWNEKLKDHYEEDTDEHG